MTEQTKWGLGGLAVGVLATATVVYLSTRDNEDRPPMVVKGGSLIFQSGINNNKPGKNWRADPNAPTEWQMDHSAGKPTATFLVMMPGSGTCGPEFVDQLNFEYTLQNGQVVQFQLTRKKQIGSSGNKMVPTIIGANLVATNSAPTPVLTFPGAGALTRVRGPGIDCQSPGAFTVHPTN